MDIYNVLFGTTSRKCACSDSLRDIPEITCENNMLILKSSEILNQILKNKKQILESSFISKQDIMDKIIEEERIHAMSLRNLSDEEYEKAEKHSVLYNKLLENAVIKVEKFSDNSELYSLNLAIPNYAKVLNEEGFFAIQDTIFQVTPNKLKIWVNSDRKDYSYLKTIEKTDQSQNVYVYDYSSKNSLLTRSIPKVDVHNQKIAFCSYRGEENNLIARTIVSFYDQTSLNFEAQGYNRDVYVRYSYQEKIDGRNFAFASAPYAMGVGADFNNNSDNFVETLNGTGSDDWYTIYFNYEFLNPGKLTQVITTAEDYYSIHRIGISVETFLGDPRHIYLSFSGILKAAMIGYDYSPAMGTEIFTSMLPE